MSAILVPALSVPIVLVLSIGMRDRAQSVEAAAEQAALYATDPAQKRTFWEKLIELSWELDFVGLVLLVGGTGLLLVSITLANSAQTTWSSRGYTTCCSDRARPDSQSDLTSRLSLVHRHARLRCHCDSGFLRMDQVRSSRSPHPVLAPQEPHVVRGLSCTNSQRCGRG